MPATMLDPKTALVVIDLQKGISKFPLVHPVGDVVANTRRLADAFRRAELPVVLVNVMSSAQGKDLPQNRTEVRFAMPTDPDFGELLPDLDAKPSDILITKRQPNAFYGTELDLQFRRRQITGIVLTGIATSAGVASTARAAHELSYNVTFASDAMTDMDATMHELMIKKIFPRLGEIDATDTLLALLRR
jgi:nicotinamidase-related amidase